MRFLLILALVGLVAYLMRRRLKLALYVAAGLYAALTLVRLLQYRGLEGAILDLAPEVGVLLAAWLVIWLVVRVAERRRSHERRGQDHAGPPARRSRR